MTERQKDALSRGTVKRNIVCAKAFVHSLLRDPRNQITIEERVTLREISFLLTKIQCDYNMNTYEKLGFNKKKLPKNITTI